MGDKEKVKQTLEEILMRVEQLTNDLSAELVVQQEIGHLEDDYERHLDWEVDRDTTWVVDQPRITEPDIRKRADARKKLHEIYDLSDCYSARYAAGRAVGLTEDDLKNIIRKEFITDLRNNLYATKEDIISNEPVFDFSEAIRYQKRQGLPTDGRQAVWGTLIQLPIRGQVPDEKKRLDSVKDAQELLRLSGSYDVRELLREAYDSVNFRSVHDEAGKALGYSSLRIALHNFIYKNNLMEGKK